MDEKELENINPIDMECNVFGDDDDLVISGSEESDDRNLQTKTGIIINFDDDDVPVRTIKADTSYDNPNVTIKSDFDNIEPKEYNQIDMETDYCDDEDEDIVVSKSKRKPIFFDSDDDIVDEAELVPESLKVEESKKKVSFGAVEDNYWENISKKHEKTNKKGAHNTSFHFAGNPEEERAIFNHMMGNSSKGSIDTAAGDISTSSIASTGSEGGSGSSSGCCESLSNDRNYTEELLSVLDVVGFEVFKNSDGSLVAIDRCDILPSVNAKSLEDLIIMIKPYIDDCVIYPLQTATNKDFSEYADWINWYDEDMRKNFPDCAYDIEICDLLVNHLKDCVIN